MHLFRLLRLKFLAQGFNRLRFCLSGQGSFERGKEAGGVLRRAKLVEGLLQATEFGRRGESNVLGTPRVDAPGNPLQGRELKRFQQRIGRLVDLLVDSVQRLCDAVPFLA